MPDHDTRNLIRRATELGRRVALVDADGNWTYEALVRRAAGVASSLLEDRGDRRTRRDIAEARVALLARPGADYVAGQWGTWIAGGLCLPLSPQQTLPEWEYMLDDSGATHAILSPEHAAAFRPLAASRHLTIVGASEMTAVPSATPLRVPELAPDCRALMLYTSGTTSRPKGVVLTHGNITAQIASLTDAWDWRAEDRALHVLPLNHTHGVINILACALWSGATCEMADGFSPQLAWGRLASGEVSVFMAVPTIYSRLIAAWREATPELQAAWSRGAAGLRLCVSGSAALPVRVLEEWRAMTGRTLLERYGMTEIGMALSNPLRGERRPGFVGTPLPGVGVRLVDDQGTDVPPGAPGELLVRGAGVFREYWARPDATAAAFRDGGWFRTGDLAVVEGDAFRILGRLSVDIIKTGGEKVSALEIEAVLRDHPAISDCAVVGLADPEWGECVAAAITLGEGATITLGELRDWARRRLSAPKLPRRLAVLTSLPRNAMGKTEKRQLIQLFEA